MLARVVLVTDPAFGDEAILRCVSTVADAVPPGALCVQLRDKRRPIVSLRVFALQLRTWTRARGVALVINGDARLARDVGADGVHLGRGAGTVADARAVFSRRVWVSVAAHSDAEARAAAAGGADAILVSPIFSTRAPSPLDPASKAPRGLAAIGAARAAAGPRMQVYALGGVTAERTHACAAAGADGVAVIRALLASPDPAREARAMIEGLPRRR